MAGTRCPPRGKIRWRASYPLNLGYTLFRGVAREDPACDAGGRDGGRGVMASEGRSVPGFLVTLPASGARGVPGVFSFYF